MANTIPAKLHLFPVIVLMAVCLTIFFNTFANEFVGDDQHLITNNRYVQDYKNIPLFFTPHYWNELHPAPGHYRPLRTVTFAIDYHCWQENPIGYHITNLVLHAINVVLVFWLVVSFTEQGKSRQEETDGRRFFMSLPFLTAVFFAAHPVHTESINLVKNRSDLLAFMFFLVSFLLFVKHITVTGRLARRVFILCAWISFIPAVLSKEMALTLPGILTLYIICFLPGPEQKKRVIRIVPYGLIIFLYFWFNYLFINPAAPLPAGVPMPGDIWQHLLTIIKTMGVYLKMLAVPFPLNVEHAFDVPVSIWSPSVLLSLSALVLIFALTLRVGRYQPLVIFAVGWVMLTLLPVTNIVYLASRPLAEQRLYIPSFGFCLLLGCGIEKLSNTWAGSPSQVRAAMATGLLALVVVGLYSVITVDRNTDWRDPVTLYTRTVVSNPNSARVRCNLGKALSEEKRYEEAINHYLIGLRLAPDNPLLHNNLGGLLVETDRLEKDPDYYEKTLCLNPFYIMAHHNLAAALPEIGKREEALAHFLTALRLKPDYAGAHNNLGAELAQAGRLEEAVSHYRTALQLEPDYAKAHNNLGLAKAASGWTREAIGHFKDAISLEPDYAEAHINLGVAFASTGRTKQAIDHYKKALLLDHDCVEVQNNLGAALAREGRFEEAISHYFDALRLRPDYIKALNNMGQALVEAGHVAEAIAYYLDALKIMPDNADVSYNLGVAYEIQGDNDKASALFKRVLQITPCHERAQQRLREL